MSIKQLHLLAWLLTFLCFLPGKAQQRYDRPLLIAEEKWLPNRSINCIFQDSEGLLWVGTNSGLYEYDGYGVRHYATSPDKENAIFTNTVTAIREDIKGNLLISTESGLSFLQKAGRRFTTLSDRIEYYKTSTSLPNGDLFLAVHDERSIYRFSPRYGPTDRPRIQPFFAMPEAVRKQMGNISAMVAFDNETLLLGSVKGLFMVNLKTKTVVATPITKPVLSLLLDGQTIWIGTNGSGLFRATYLDHQLQVGPAVHFGATGQAGYDRINNLLAGPSGELFVSTPNQLFQREPTTQQFTEIQQVQSFLADNNLLSMFLDQAGILWVGTLRGLFKVRPNPLRISRIKLKTPSYIPLNNQIDLITTDGVGNLLLGTHNDGLFTYNPRQQLIQRSPYLTERLSFLGNAADGQLLLAKNNDVYRQKSIQDKPVLLTAIHHDVNTMVEVMPGEWWLGAQTGGLFSFVEHEKALFSGLLKRVNAQFDGKSPIFTARKDAGGNVWIGSRGDGLVRANLQTGAVVKYVGKNQRGMTSRRILSIYVDARRQVWVATREGGLFRYQPESDSFRRFTTDDGLPSNVVCALAENKQGNLFVSTDNGLAVYLPNEMVPFRAFGVGDGIEHTYFTFNASAVDTGGTVYFGNSNGLYAITDLQLPRQPATKLFISQFNVLDDPRRALQTDQNRNLWEEAVQKRAVTLSHQQNSFEIAWSALDFTDPSQNRYAYRLRPHTEAWTVVSGDSRRVRFLDIPAGDYTLEIKHSDSYGAWNDALTSLSITVLNPFWLTPPAYFLYLLMLSAAAWGAYTIWKRYRRLELSLANEMANQSLQTQQMVHFSDLSHEIRNRLTLMLGPLEKALNGKKVNQGVLHNLYEQTIRLKRISDQIMNIRRSESGEFTLKVAENLPGAFISRVVQDVEPLALIRAISLENQITLSAETAWFDTELLEIVLLNLLSNAIKYTPEGGRVGITAQLVTLGKSDLPAISPQEGTYLKCTVEDTGIGIPSNDLNYLFSRYYRASNTRQHSGQLSGTGLGLELVGRLLRKHKGFFDVQSRENEFTRVAFFIPIDKDHYEVSERKISVSTDRIIEPVPVDPQPDNLPGRAATPPLRILIADDDADIRQLLVDTFAGEAEVTTATNGQEALQRSVSEEFDAIISDLSMPIMNGVTLLQTLKTNPLLNHIPFVVLTGQGDERQKLICLQNNADDFIEKPFSPDLLRWRVKNLIHNRQLLRTKYSHVVSLGPKEEPIESEDEKFINRVIELIETHIASNDLTVEFLAEECSMSRATFYRHVESLIGEPPSVFIRKYRLKKAALLLKNSDKYIAQVAYDTGFNDPKYFAKCFAKEFGCSPAEYVKRIKAASEPNTTV